MAQAVEKLADHVVVTSDNPRSEDPATIIEQVFNGFDHQEKVTSIVDRHDAIQYAITHAADSDVILLAGKGHETYQIMGDRQLAFDDRKVARTLLAARQSGVRQ
jgi:UDP-N-acetylmuramoyl-L-alanyl-D-glutamate--2,6-diaminopimelate ligase